MTDIDQLQEILRLQVENQALKNELAQRGRLTELPGTKYSRYALPIDYVPSRDYAPRWGNTRPPIEPLADFFAAHVGRYESVFSKMCEIAPTFCSLNVAWTSVPFARFDLLALSAILVNQRPRLYMEIGSGISTKIARWTVDHFKLGTRIVSIEPNNRGSDDVCDVAFPECLERIEPKLFDQLNAGDVLFLDGSHRSFTNSDVTVFMIDILPRLKPGVVVHFHDINLPYDYEEWAMPWYWNEQYLLAVYMMNGVDRIEPVFPTAWLDKSGGVEPSFTSLLASTGWTRQELSGGGSMWFRITAPLPEITATNTHGAAE